MNEFDAKGYNDQGTHWALYANCQFPDSPNMFPNEADEKAVQEALSECDGCPVRLMCLEAALDNRERFGIWGGTTPKQRDYKIKYRVSTRVPLVKVP